eukprot:NODE_889_length_1323_cov_405.553628.p1 GENE.NODE_889_length_1323_cov_405.553628~~NODE_889_length_1323_cov_405.553628.p1  ORF type:complete len:405 (+),score=61.79 NODE_889_length_1323_cov_405.553628:3-1217(+)
MGRRDPAADAAAAPLDVKSPRAGKPDNSVARLMQENRRLEKNLLQLQARLEEIIDAVFRFFEDPRWQEGLAHVGGAGDLQTLMKSLSCLYQMGIQGAGRGGLGLGCWSQRPRFSSGAEGSASAPDHVLCGEGPDGLLRGQEAEGAVPSASPHAAADCVARSPFSSGVDEGVGAAADGEGDAAPLTPGRRGHSDPSSVESGPDLAAAAAAAAAPDNEGMPGQPQHATLGEHGEHSKHGEHAMHGEHVEQASAEPQSVQNGHNDDTRPHTPKHCPVNPEPRQWTPPPLSRSPTRAENDSSGMRNSLFMAVGTGLSAVVDLLNTRSDASSTQLTPARQSNSAKPPQRLGTLVKRNARWARLLEDPDGLFTADDVIDDAYQRFLADTLRIMERDGCLFCEAVRRLEAA